MKHTNFTDAEDQVILIGLRRGKRVVEIAEFMGRTRQGVYKRIRLMRDDGRLQVAGREGAK